MSSIGAWVYSATLEHTLCHMSMVKEREDPWLSVFIPFPTESVLGRDPVHQVLTEKKAYTWSFVVGCATGWEVVSSSTAWRVFPSLDF